jgi:hypothetical protein
VFLLAAVSICGDNLLFRFYKKGLSMRYILFVLCATSCLLAPALAEPPAPQAGPGVENVSPPAVPVTPAKPSVENVSPPSPPCAAQDEKLAGLEHKLLYVQM